MWVNGKEVRKKYGARLNVFLSWIRDGVELGRFFESIGKAGDLVANHERLTTEELMCDLTEDELREYGEHLTQSLIEFEELKEEKKAAVKGYSKRLDELERKVMRLAHVTIRKRELRPVSVKMLFDFNTGTVGYVRIDTGELYHKRAMTTEERQLDLVGEDDDRIPESA